MEKDIAAVYVVKPELLVNLSEELGRVEVIRDLIFSPVKNVNACFALDVWLDPKIVTFQSISEAVKILRQAGKFWYLHPIENIRRSKLIAEQLRKLPNLIRHFPMVDEIPQIGAFSLLDQNTLIYSQHRKKKWPDGKCFFIEDKVNPPNRAYLKLWEAFTMLNKHPQKGEKVLDLGASPGGWTYVAHSLGADVTAVDKAALSESIQKLPHVNFLQQSAFAIEPERIEEAYDWVLSDVICYPERAYQLVQKWINSGKAKQIIFTVKLQGKTDLSIIQKFQAIPNSGLMNLYYNKHEATFFYPYSIKRDL
ncbi:SAM-dependent methyltransferase (plasmid) [Legionella adelaidensis]|uniref:SAM-dependent methyltransferase n=1 Tax=Legionella adelaidensis TaxID=45056 RepID=A0A0W0R599_9GAMM|nr:SAM-dependent methyltransferase [Legionella adelaidensis]KTC66273.1 SAM-dependent methyltransferase [Legionella adelaidensis]VEH84869.1 SAM-dependent methyltransferase [Legionella adelaidensis]